MFCPLSFYRIVRKTSAFRLGISERQAKHDRDENACINLFNYNKSNTAVGTTVAACGGNVRPKSSKKIISKKTRAVSVETGISALSPEINCLSSLIEAIQS